MHNDHLVQTQTIVLWASFVQRACALPRPNLSLICLRISRRTYLRTPVIAASIPPFAFHKPATKTPVGASRVSSTRNAGQMRSATRPPASARVSQELIGVEINVSPTMPTKPAATGASRALERQMVLVSARPKRVKSVVIQTFSDATKPATSRNLSALSASKTLIVPTMNPYVTPAYVKAAEVTQTVPLVTASACAAMARVWNVPKTRRPHAMATPAIQPPIPAPKH